MESFDNPAVEALTFGSIVDRLLLKKEYLDAGNPEQQEIKTALIVGGGGMRGVFSGGVVIALDELGLREVFDSAIGISAGAAAIAYLLAGEPKLGTSIYPENLSNSNFVNPFRVRNILDIAYLGEIFRNVKPLNQSSVRASRTNFYIGVTDAETGKGEYWDVTNNEEIDIIDTILASSSLPGFTKGPMKVGDRLLSDGVTGCTKPIEFAINELGATDILLVLNRKPYKSADSLTDRSLAKLAVRGYSKPFKAAHLTRRIDNDFDMIKNYQKIINIEVIYPTGEAISPYCTDAKKLAEVALVGFNQVAKFFSV